ncbi:glycosyltransferase [Bifidobacterium animalis]|uniref:glycosyltransferase n=1 Tax=Bifidobacterium animalis TaxID=28025 RepID=UPI001651328C|nr:glycosyltransferase [Bifidobacterium animalis]UBZ01286.1 glycosyltransferase [Bifidobacterium animalis subsp. lactis]
MSRMKVMEFVPEFVLPGAEIMVKNLLIGLHDSGAIGGSDGDSNSGKVDVIGVSLYDTHNSITEDLASAGVPLYFLHKKSGLDLKLYLSIAKLLRAEHPDVVHTHLYSAKYVLPIARLYGIPVLIHTVHNLAQYELRPGQRRLQNWLYQHGDVTPVSISPTIAKSIEKVYSLPESRCPVIVNGVDGADRTPGTDKLTKAEQYNGGDVINSTNVVDASDITHSVSDTQYESKAHPFVFLHVGRYANQKNHAMLLSSFAAVHAELPNTRLVLVGQGELFDTVKHQIQKLGLTECVTQVGALTDVSPWYKRADAFVLSSKYEGFPITLIEAFHAGLTCVCTRVGGVPDIIESGRNGLLAEIDKEDFAAAMTAVAANPVLSKRLSDAALKDSAHYSTRAMSDAYIALFEQLLRRGRDIGDK